MEIDSFFGIPAHPLFVHLPVVLTPLAAMTALVMFKPEWRRSYLWVTVVLSGVALIGAQLAVGSGESLEESVNESPALELHTDLGETARTIIAIFFVITLALAIYEYMQRRRTTSEDTSRPTVAIATVLTSLMVIAGAFATGWVIKAGHQGAKVTWEDVGSEGGD